MRTKVPEKLLAIVDEIDATGNSNLTRLTVLKKWFQVPLDVRLPLDSGLLPERLHAKEKQTVLPVNSLKNHYYS